jgi:predicted metal-binding membrane protein
MSEPLAIKPGVPSLRSERSVLLALLVGLSALSWAASLRIAARMEGPGHAHATAPLALFADLVANVCRVVAEGLLALGPPPE